MDMTMDGVRALDPDSDRVVAGLLYLLVDCATREICLGRMAAVAHHFELLADCADVAPPLRGLAEKLYATWIERCREARDTALARVPGQRDAMH
ncbi:MAG: hypothetical protein MUC68_01290 [Burkholderiaceae bacterium]|jgi:hypothetical protein|nr:hypothetical protein [Burkholderiaceae bacterium]